MSNNNDDNSIKSLCCPEPSYTCPTKKTTYHLCYFCLPVFTNFIVDACQFCNEPPGGSVGFDCRACYFCLSPIGLAIDIITVPFRSIFATKRCCCLPSNSEQQESESGK